MRWLRAFLLFLSLAAGGVAALGQTALGWADDGELKLEAQEATDVMASAALFTKRIGRVTFDPGKACITCGDFADLNGIGADHVARRLNTDFLVFLKRQLQQSAIFPDTVRERLSLAATLTGLQQTSSIGAAEENRSRVISGAVLTTKVSIRYELIDQGQYVGTWNITTTATSNSMAASTRLGEAIDGALKRNVRAMLLKMLSDYSTADAARAHAALTALHAEVDNTRSVLGYLVLGAGRTADAIGDGIVVVAQNSGTIAATLNAKTAEMARIEAASRGSSVEEDRARVVRKIEFDARVALQQEDPNSELNRAKRAREQALESRRKEEAENTAQRAERLRKQNVADKQEPAQVPHFPSAGGGTVSGSKAPTTTAAATALAPPTAARSDPAASDSEGCIEAIGWCSSGP
ncbi:MAG: hypothetical protein Q8N05_22035, partial [Bacteroidota bacterium]|nr:hypothetical protein [Bacteroidota bacterium]